MSAHLIDPSPAPERKNLSWQGVFSKWTSQVHNLFRMGKTPVVYGVAVDMGDERPELMTIGYEECEDANTSMNPLAMLVAQSLIELSKGTHIKTRELRKAFQVLVKQALLVVRRDYEEPENKCEQ